MKEISLKRERGLLNPPPTHVITAIYLIEHSRVRINYTDEINHTENYLMLTAEFAEDNNLINFGLLKKILP